MAGARRLRGQIEEPGFAESRSAIIADAQRWDEFWFAASWALQHDPEGFDQVDNIDLWVIICEPSRFLTMPRLRVYYSFDDDNVYLKWVELG